MGMLVNPYRFAAAGGGGGSYGAHRYWRIFCSNNNGGGSFTALAEVEFRIGGTDQTGTGTAYGSNQLSGNEYSKAFDNNSTTAWAASGVTNQYIAYDFGSAIAIEDVTVMPDLGLVTSAPKDCNVQYSDDNSTWTTAFSFSLYGPVGRASYTFPEPAPVAGFHRLWRLFCIDNNGGGAFITLDEMEMRASAGGADQTANVGTGSTSGRVIFSSDFSGNDAYRVFDNVTGTANYWASNGVTNAYVGFIFPAAVKVEEIALTAGKDAPSRNPKNMTLDYSDDGTTWTTQKTFAAQTGWVANETRVLTAI
jgi:hypothetical protein